MGCVAALLSGSAGADAAARPVFTPGAAGVGDPYFPLDGNGGYDVEHYLLQVRYEPSSDRLSGMATLSAQATQNLSSFNLDLVGLTLNAVEVDGCAATWSRDGAELRIEPARGILAGQDFEVRVAYSGVPAALSELGGSGFMTTPDGALIAGEPHGASSWFPANDHPRDRASFTFELTVPEGLEAVANGELAGQSSSDGWTTWIWDARAPMATYLAGVSIGDLVINVYEQGGIRYWDGLNAALATPVAPPAGDQYLISGRADATYQRLARTLSVPAEGAQLSFWVSRDTEWPLDFFFVEAHTVGQDDWTTLPDADGFAALDVGYACPSLQNLHPFLRHYQAITSDPEVPCVPAGETGEWWAATGQGTERWTLDLGRFAGSDVEVSLSYATDDFDQVSSVLIDDIVVSTGDGSTSFEADADVLDGWQVLGAPPGSAANAADWFVGTSAEGPPPSGAGVLETLARQPEIIAFLSDRFGPYPFDVSGAIVTNAPLAFALETQSRPIYPAGAVDGSASTVVHELAHQWFGDSLTLDAWQHIWLNEGFATYAEWLYEEQRGDILAREWFDIYMSLYTADDPFWTSTIGDPGPDAMFSSAVYIRGALTLHDLRTTVGDDTFFDILQTWVSTHAGGTVTTDDFIAVSEAVSGRDLTAFFDAWLFTPERPNVATPASAPIAQDTFVSIAAPHAVAASPVIHPSTAYTGKARGGAQLIRR